MDNARSIMNNFAKGSGQHVSEKDMQLAGNMVDTLINVNNRQLEQTNQAEIVLNNNKSTTPLSSTTENKGEQSSNNLNNQIKINSSLTPSGSTNNQNNEKWIYLDADQFQDLVYYWIINAVAKEEKMGILTEQDRINNNNNYPSDNTVNLNPVIIQGQAPDISQKVNDFYNDTLKNMQICFYNDNMIGALQSYDNYYKSIKENPNLKNFIAGQLVQKENSINFWGPFLWGVLRRASFFCSLYKVWRSNCPKDKIDAALGLSYVLLILFLIFRFVAIANAILGFIFLVSLVYKAINQYRQARPKYLIRSLLKTETFFGTTSRLDYALVPEVGNLRKFHDQEANQILEQEKDEREKSQKIQYRLIEKQLGRQYPQQSQNPFGLNSPFKSFQYFDKK